MTVFIAGFMIILMKATETVELIAFIIDSMII